VHTTFYVPDRSLFPALLSFLPFRILPPAPSPSPFLFPAASARESYRGTYGRAFITRVYVHTCSAPLADAYIGRASTSHARSSLSWQDEDVWITEIDRVSVDIQEISPKIGRAGMVCTIIDTTREIREKRRLKVSKGDTKGSSKLLQIE